LICSSFPRLGERFACHNRAPAPTLLSRESSHVYWLPLLSYYCQGQIRPTLYLESKQSSESREINLMHLLFTAPSIHLTIVHPLLGIQTTMFRPQKNNMPQVLHHPPRPEVLSCMRPKMQKTRTQPLEMPKRDRSDGFAYDGELGAPRHPDDWRKSCERGDCGQGVHQTLRKGSMVTGQV